jgi:trimethylguanosine synthase
MSNLVTKTLIGPTYTTDQIFDLSKMQPYDIEELYAKYSKITTDMVLYLPRNSNLNLLTKYAPEDREMPIIHYCMSGASKVSHNSDLMIPY